MKPTEDAIQSIFKSIMSGFKAESAYIEYISCNPFDSQSLIASALNSNAHREACEGAGSEYVKVKMIPCEH